MSAEKKGLGIRYSIFIYFTVTALVAILSIGLSMYDRFSDQLTEASQNEDQILMNQVNRSVDTYLRNIMRLSDALYYGVVKNTDISEEGIFDRMKLLYDSNDGTVENIALFSGDGELLSVAPAARLRSTVRTWEESWFKEPLEKMENLHFSMPHVQYIFDDAKSQYKWVISVSRAVEVTKGVSVSQGVLLIDIRYSSLEQLLENVTLGNGGYVYLISNDGQIIYHPKAQLIDSGRVQEDHQKAAGYRDGTYEEVFQGEKRYVTVKSVGYTGWKLVGVTPTRSVSFSGVKTRLFILFVVLLILFLLLVINFYISSKITDPIHELEGSVRKLEDGKLDVPVYIGGSYEIQHLGRSIANMASQIQVLMQDIVEEHEAKRKREFDTLQSQINPHFLYNTLDIIVWMVENEKKSEAVKVVTALARFFRISLSKGKSIIPVRDELEHVRNYLTIQQMRFKNKFTYQISAREEVLELASLKLMLQPLVENAIYHGVKRKRSGGTIYVSARAEGQTLYLTVRDDGAGIPAGRLADIRGWLADPESRKGQAGFGLSYMAERLRLTYGPPYGIRIRSQEGGPTEVTVCLPFQKGGGNV